MSGKNTLKAALLFAWIILTLSLFKAELRAVSRIPGNLRASYEERKSKADGPVFSFAQNLARIAPPGSSIALVSNKTTALKKIVYYMYPRGLKPLNAYEGAASALKEDFLAVYLPGEPAMFLKLNADPSLEKIFEAGGGSVYKIKRSGG